MIVIENSLRRYRETPFHERVGHSIKKRPPRCSVITQLASLQQLPSSATPLRFLIPHLALRASSAIPPRRKNVLPLSRRKIDGHVALCMPVARGEALVAAAGRYTKIGGH